MTFKRSKISKRNISIIGYSFLAVLVLLQSLVFQVSYPDTVLCIGDDGHVMFEKVGTDTHCDHPSDPLLLDQLAENDFHENDCVDIPLKQHLENAYFKHKVEKRIDKSDRHFIVEINYLTKQSVRDLNFSHNYFACLPSLDAVKSVVLLI